MAKTRVINTVFWEDNYTGNLDPTEKLLFLYFLTNTSTNISGIYQITLKKVAVETGIDKDMVEKIIKRFSNDGKIFYIDGWLGIRNFIKHQNQKSPLVEKGIERELSEIPENIKNVVFGDKNTLSKGIDTLSHLTKLNLTKLNLSESAEQNQKSNEIQKEEFENTGIKKEIQRTANANAWLEQAWIEEMAGKWFLKFNQKIPQNRIEFEIKKFISYWTEQSLGGRKARWEKQTVFDPERRLITWFSKFAENYQNKNQNNKYQVGEV